MKTVGAGAIPEMLDFSLDARLAGQAAVEEKRFHAERLVQAWSWKSKLGPSFPLIVCLMGGTGTGKSTLFNSLAEREISEVGRRRPCTIEPRILAHESAIDQLKDCPFLEFQSESATAAESGDTAIVRHSEPDAAGIILVDTPDFDSVELSHHVVADNFFVLSDVLVFITSQEKYADLTGRHVSRRALDWGKMTMFVMNKAVSDTAYDDFRNKLKTLSESAEPVRVDRLEPPPSLIPGIRRRPEFAWLFMGDEGDPEREALRATEMRRLSTEAVSKLEELESVLDEELKRIAAVNARIREILARAAADMDARLDGIVSPQMEVRIRERLQELLRKYDILFHPRNWVRNTVRNLVSAVRGALGLGGDSSREELERTMRSQDLHAARSAVRLDPLEAAVAKLNLKVTELLCSDPSLDDLCRIAGSDVPRWDGETIEALYDEAFPGVEKLLETQFQEIRHGLSASDEIKLYGTYTIWALFLVTVEIVVGGGFTLLDALLGGVIVPFIPQWVLSVKVIEMLRDMATRVDREHRHALRGILEKQAYLYVQRFSELVPDRDARARLRKLKEQIRSWEPSG